MYMPRAIGNILLCVGGGQGGRYLRNWTEHGA